MPRYSYTTTIYYVLRTSGKEQNFITEHEKEGKT
jgi:hypothetical protein